MDIQEKIDELRGLAEKQDAFNIKRKLKEILPEYEPNDVTEIIKTPSK